MRIETQRDSTRKLELESLKVTHLLYIWVPVVDSCMCGALGFTGIDQAYEAPEKPDLVLKGGQWSVDDSLSKLVSMLRRQVSMLFIS